MGRWISNFENVEVGVGEGGVRLQSDDGVHLKDVGIQFESDRGIREWFWCTQSAVLWTFGGHTGPVFSMETRLFGVYLGRRAPPKVTPVCGTLNRHKTWTFSCVEMPLRWWRATVMAGRYLAADGSCCAALDAMETWFCSAMAEDPSGCYHRLSKC